MDDLDIAIIGMACRFPGASSPEQLWHNLRNGVESIRRFSDEELAAMGVPPRIRRHPRYVPAAPTLDGIDRFDAGFFGFSPREAEIMDPQQRVFLEVVWEALERAGCDPRRHPGTIALFAGASLSQYLLDSVADDSALMLSVATLQSLIGNDKDYLATQTAYKLDLRGPVMSVQTACSTSLVAVHLACQCLLDREADLALAGGVTVRLPRMAGYLYEEGGVTSPDGRCRPFDARARGTVFGSGAGVVVLKRLAAALEDGDPVLAVIKGSAVNNDGARKVGFTAPGGEGQAEVIAEALTVAQVEPRTIGYVETHGTGTPLGDPVEVAALTEAFAGAMQGEGDRQFCAIGAIKSNFGHLESAAGVAGLIKTVLALEHGELPPSLHFEQPNPEIDFAASPFYVNASLREWRRGPWPRRAGVSSFGIGGTNAHVIVEEAPPEARVAGRARVQAAGTGAAPAPAGGARDHVLPLSARSPGALRELARAVAALLDAGDEEVADICYTAAVRRAHHAHRLSAVGRTRAALKAQLDGFANGEGRAGLAAGEADPGRRPRLVFVFPGQGSQWAGMGRELMAAEPVFAQAIAGCEAAMARWTDWSLHEVLAGTRPMDRVDVIQPTLFAMQVALAALWRSWGVAPDVVLGQSMGEVAAAHVAGALRLEDAARVICERSRLVRERGRKDGGMAVVELSAAEAMEAIAGHAGRVSLAVASSPRSSVLAGDRDALAEIMGALEARGVFCRWVRVDFASHSPHVEPLGPMLLERLAPIRPRAAQIAMYSSVRRRRIEGEALDAAYWVDNLREPVRFAEAVARLFAEGHDVFLEISPHPIATVDVEACLARAAGQGQRQDQGQATPAPGRAGQQAGKPVILGSLRREEPERAAMLSALGGLYAAGRELDWSKLYGAGSCVRLPAYPWQRERYWQAPAARPRSAGGGREGGHPVLQQRVDVAGDRAGVAGTHVWEGEVALAALAHLGDHRVMGTPVVPGAVYLELALAAAAEVLGGGGHGDDAGGPVVLEDVMFQEPLVLAAAAGAAQEAAPSTAPDASARVQLAARREPADALAFRVCSRPAARMAPAAPWTAHASGTARRGAAAGAEVEALDVIRARCAATMARDDFYRALRGFGIEYGPAFQGIEALWQGQGEALARVVAPAAVSSEDPDAGLYRVHPAVLDACLQASAATARLLSAPAAIADADAGAAAGVDAAADAGVVYLPVAIDRLVWSGRSALAGALWCHVEDRPGASTAVGASAGDAGALPEVLESDIAIRDQAGRMVLEIQGLRRRKLDRTALAMRIHGGLADADWLFALSWQQVEAPTAASPRGDGGGVWLVFADTGAHGPDGRGLGNALAARLGSSAITVEAGAAGDGCEQVGPGRYRIDPVEPGAYRALIARVLDGRALAGVAHLWSLDVAAPARAAGDPEDMDLDAAARLGTTSALCLVQALAADDRPAACRAGARLWLVTRGAQSTTEGLLDGTPPRSCAVAQAALWGLARTVPREHPELRTTAVDLDPGPDPGLAPGPAPAGASDRDLDALWRELHADDGEEQIAWRHGRRHAARLVRAPRPPAASAPDAWDGALRPDGMYLITGGLGGVGLSLAHAMVEAGARHLALLGRGPGSDAAAEAVRALEAQGATVIRLRADVADADQLAAALAALPPDLPLRGIVHGAAVLDDGILLRQDAARFRAVLAPKAYGAWHLHRLTREAPLDFFVMLSSVVSLMGLPGQSNYSAANAFLDALAWHRRALGLPAHSLRWGPWAEVGLAAAQENRGARAAEYGLDSIPPARGAAMFLALVRRPAASIAVMPFDLDRWQRSSFVAAAPLFAVLGEEARAGARAAGSAAAATAGDVRERLRAAEPGQRRHLLEAHVRAQLAQVLRLDRDRIALETPFRNLGLDSLMALSLRNQLEASLGVTLSATMVWGYPTVAALAAHLAEVMGLPLEDRGRQAHGAAPSTPSASSAPAGADGAMVEDASTLRADLDGVLGGIQDLSDEDALAALLGDLGGGD